MKADIDGVRRAFDAVRRDKAENNSFWDYQLELTLPRRAYIERQETTAGLGDSYETKLYDQTAIEATQILAAGHATYLTPPGEAWFKFSPPAHLRGNDEAENFYAACSDIMREQLAASNFYATIFEVYLDRSAVGTGGMFVRSGKTKALQFDYIPIGDYSIAENDEGVIDVLAREFNWTAEQIAEEFGEDKLPPSVRDALMSPEKRYTQRFEIRHLIRPRTNRDPSLRDGVNMPYESVYFDAREEHIYAEEGFEEFPAMITRYLKWGKDQAYGVSPTRVALPNIQQLQYLQRMQDLLVELMGFPRVVQLAEQSGEVDLRAGGVTKVSQQFAAANLPREWATAGRPEVIDARIIQKQDEVKRLYHVPLFQMWAQIEQQMTATEASYREREKLLLFSPTFIRLIDDMGPMMLRVFSMLLRAGKFPEIPEALLQQGPHGVQLEDPSVEWQSKIALALRQLGLEGFDRMAMRAQGMAQYSPDIVDNIDFDIALRETARAEGVPMEFLRSQADVAAIRKAKAEAMAQQQQIENAPALAGAAKDMVEVSDQVDVSGLGL